MGEDETASWSRTLDPGHASPDAIESAWRQLWDAADASSGGQLHARTQTLLILTKAPLPPGALATVASRHPGRFVTVVIQADPAERVEAELLEAAAGVPGSESVVLPLGADASLHWAEAVMPLLLSDVPVHALVLDPSLVRDGEFAQLLETLDEVVMDTAGATTPWEIWRPIADVRADLAVADLDWTRLGCWRQVLAASFDPEACQEMLPALSRVEGSGSPQAQAEAGWIYGWLDSRLFPNGGGPRFRYAADGRMRGLHKILLALGDDDRSACTVVHTGRQLHATVTRDSAVLATVHTACPRSTWAQILSETLSRGYDPLFRQALDVLLAAPPESDGDG